MNTNLRLNSVWALKHLVFEASSDLKRTVLDELGPGWLKQIVNNDADGSNSVPPRNREREDENSTPHMSTPNAAGEQVDLLNAVVESSLDFGQASQDGDEDGDEDLRMTDSVGALGRAELSRRQPTLSSRRDTDRGSYADDAGRAERRPSVHALTDETAVQKEGLDLIRNLMSGSGAAEMIDLVFSELGQEKLFEMLAAKLRPRVYNAFNRDRRSSESSARQVQPQTDIVISVCYLIVHIAAGRPGQRQLLISQTELLKLMVPLFNHPNREVRGCCAWFVINLTWIDDQSDSMNCRERAKSLRNLGVCEKLESMEKDNELDIRERSKTARHQISTLLRM